MDEESRKFTAASVMITRYNGPCVHPGNKIEKHYPGKSDGLAKRFIIAAEGKRGFVGMVVKPSVMSVGRDALLRLFPDHNEFLMYNRGMALFLTILAVFVVVVANEMWWRYGVCTANSAEQVRPLDCWQLRRLLAVLLVNAGYQAARLSFCYCYWRLQEIPNFPFDSWRAAGNVGRSMVCPGSGGLGLHCQATSAYLYGGTPGNEFADGLAAVIGTRFGNRHRYTVLGSHKSLIGTLTFFGVSCLILGNYAAWTSNVAPLLLLPVAVGATILENVAGWGLDNAAVPLFVAGTLLLIS